MTRSAVVATGMEGYPQVLMCICASINGPPNSHSRQHVGAACSCGKRCVIRWSGISRLVRVYAAQQGVHDVRDDSDQGARRAAQGPPRQLAVVRVHDAHLTGSDRASAVSRHVFWKGTGTELLDLHDVVTAEAINYGSCDAYSDECSVAPCTRQGCELASEHTRAEGPGSCFDPPCHGSLAGKDARTTCGNLSTHRMPWWYHVRCSGSSSTATSACSATSAHLTHFNSVKTCCEATGKESLHLAGTAACHRAACITKAALVSRTMGGPQPSE